MTASLEATTLETEKAQPTAALQAAFYELNDTFGLDSNQLILLEGYKACGHPAVPAQQPYVFDRDRLRKLLAFLDEPSGDGLFLIGPTGCGKTSLVCQAASRLNWPCQLVPVHGRLELDDLLGQKVLDNGSTPFQAGALTKAVREGHLLILDEMDVADPAELAGLYDLLDGAPLVLGVSLILTVIAGHGLQYKRHDIDFSQTREGNDQTQV